MEELEKYQNKGPEGCNPSIFISLVLSMLATIYFILKNLFLYKYLADFQAEYLFDGAFYPKYTGVVVFILILIPIGIGVQLVGAWFKKK